MTETISRAPRVIRIAAVITGVIFVAVIVKVAKVADRMLPVMRAKAQH